MNRFFVKKIDQNNIAIYGDDYKHAKKVLRLVEGSNVYAVYNEVEYLAKIIKDDGENLWLEMIEETKVIREPDVEIHIYQSLPKSSKMDFIIQKNVESGISKLTPIRSDRSLIKIKNEKKEKKKLERWTKISEEAAKQSMRNIIPEIRDIISFDDMIEELKFKIKNENIEILVPYENEEDCSIKDINLNKEKIAAVVGPEGGFEEEEIQRLIEIGVKPVTLGPRILRSETAALVLSTLILHETDNMRRK